MLRVRFGFSIEDAQQRVLTLEFLQSFSVNQGKDEEEATMDSIPPVGLVAPATAPPEAKIFRPSGSADRRSNFLLPLSFFAL